jgi:phosphoribosylformylglycinamidine synthase PurS subunit
VPLVEKIIVDVMLKPEILDPQGRAILGIFNRGGHDAISNVRQGKRFEISITGPVTDELLDQIEELAATVLSNPVIETYAIYADEGETE